MSCDHSIITDLDLAEDKFILIHCGPKLIDAVFVKNKVTSAHSVKVFDTAQEVIDEGLALGLTCTPEQMICAMEHGAVLPADVLAWVISEKPNMDMDLVKRLEALKL